MRENERRRRHRGSGTNRIHAEHGVQLGAWSHDLEIRTWAEAKSGTLNWQSHPGTLRSLRSFNAKKRRLYSHKGWRTLPSVLSASTVTVIKNWGVYFHRVRNPPLLEGLVVPWPTHHVQPWALQYTSVTSFWELKFWNLALFYFCLGLKCPEVGLLYPS